MARHYDRGMSKFATVTGYLFTCAALECFVLVAFRYLATVS